MVDSQKKLEIYDRLVTQNGIEAVTFQAIHSACNISTFRPFGGRGPTVWVHRCEDHHVTSQHFNIGGHGVASG